VCITIDETVSDIRDQLFVNPKIRKQWQRQRKQKMDQSTTLEQFIEKKYITPFYRALES